MRDTIYSNYKQPYKNHVYSAEHVIEMKTNFGSVLQAKGERKSRLIPFTPLGPGKQMNLPPLREYVAPHESRSEKGWSRVNEEWSDWGAIIHLFEGFRKGRERSYRRCSFVRFIPALGRIMDLLGFCSLRSSVKVH